MSARTPARPWVHWGFVVLTLPSLAGADDSCFAEFPLDESGSPFAALFLDGEEISVAVDTGASVSVVDIRFRAKLGEALSRHTASSNISRSEVRRYACPAGSFGKFALGLPSLVCTEFPEAMIGEGVSGLLGMDFLRSHCLDIDPDAGVFRISDRAPSDLPEQRVQQSLAYEDGLPVVLAGTSPAVDLWVMVDTGSTTGISLSPIDENRVFPNGFAKSLAMHAGTIHGDTNELIVRLPRFVLGGLVSNDLLCDVHNRSSATTLIGCGYLYRYRVIFDFPNDTLTLVDRQKAFEDDADMSGIHLRRHGKRCLMDEIDNSSPASEMGLHPADELIAINGKLASNLRPTAIRQLLRSGNGKVVRLRVKDAHAERTVDLTLRRRI